ncbi:MAG TPA: excinuclease ABC subunit C [Firmicutes bacterium]|nr:excinuclease ABC subunit C [Bacillota bacterium]HAW99653.1 excinuclease ABC subunit C [Bacillota bacterium]
MINTEIVKRKIELLPDHPGCYLMKNKDGTIIYVGKAKSLVKRVKQYFTRPQEGKVFRMVLEVTDFDTIETDSEKESLLLEINLIQKYYPKYNIMLKDGKMYPYIALKKMGDPYLKIARNDRDKSFSYFGPFPNSGSAYRMIDLLNKIYPLRKCKNIPNRACLYYHLGQCMGPCINDISKSDNKDMISHITKFLNGDASEVKQEMTAKMRAAANDLRFEEAQEYKETLDTIENVLSSQKIMMQDHIDRDIVGYSQRDGYISILFLLYRKGVLLGKNLFVVEKFDDINSELTDYIYQFYLNHPKPKELIISEKSIADILESSLGIKVIVPSRGVKKDLLFMALENAKAGLDEHFMTARLEDDNLKLLEELGNMLNISTPLDIELYDNSHLQGTEAIGAMVKFINGVKVPSMYRKYKIRQENKRDDLASMEEVLTRRLTRLKEENSKMPDLIIVDGGMTQVEIAYNVREQLNVNVNIAGLAKNDKHETDALINGNTGEFIPLNHKSPLFFMLMRMQDEVHRFAISYHRHKREKSFFETIYDDIPGIGKKRRIQLLSAYPTLDSLKSVTLEELKQIIPEESAKLILEKRDSRK